MQTVLSPNNFPEGLRGMQLHSHQYHHYALQKPFNLLHQHEEDDNRVNLNIMPTIIDILGTLSRTVLPAFSSLSAIASQFQGWDGNIEWKHEKKHCMNRHKWHGISNLSWSLFYV